MTENTKKINPTSLILQSLLVGLVGFLVICWYYVGLPYDFSMDLVIHEGVLQGMSYTKLFQLALNPLTPAWFFMTEMGYLRPIYYLWVKGFFDLFGPNLVPVHLMVASGNAVLTAVFFIGGTLITKRKLVRLEAYLKAICPVATAGDLEAQQEVLELQGKIKTVDEQLCDLKSPAEKVRIFTTALKTRQTSLLAAEAALVASRATVLDRKAAVRAAQHEVEAVTLKLTNATAEAAPPT